MPGEWKLKVVGFDVMKNSLTLEREDGARLTVPLDHVDTGWEDASGWHLHLRGRCSSDGARMKYDVRLRDAAPDHS